jgi:hypothetical protein
VKIIIKQKVDQNNNVLEELVAEAQSRGVYDDPSLPCPRCGKGGVVDMSKAQFGVISNLIRAQENTTRAAWLVLVDGEKTTMAARKSGLTPQSVHNTVIRFRKAHDLVMSAYGKR